MTEAVKVIELEVNKLVKQIMPMLRGHHRKVQWAVIAELMALWLIEQVAIKSHLLEPLLRVHVNSVRRLVELNEKAQKN